MADFIGKVAVVTGAGSGIGAATAAEFSRRGAAVVLVDIDGDRAEGQAAALRSAGGSALAVAADVSVEGQVQRMIGAAVMAFGGLDIMHNNAAAVQLSAKDDDVAAMDVDVWDRVMEVNLRGAMLGCKHAIPCMLARGGGVIVNTSSGAGILAEPTRVAYGASKAALNSLTRSVAVQYGKRGIRCVAVAPGITLSREAQSALGATRWLAMMRRHHVTPRLGDPADVARLVAFLASDDAGFITGSVHSIDGGIIAGVPYTADMLELGSSII